MSYSAAGTGIYVKKMTRWFKTVWLEIPVVSVLNCNLQAFLHHNANFKELVRLCIVFSLSH